MWITSIFTNSCQIKCENVMPMFSFLTHGKVYHHWKKIAQNQKRLAGANNNKIE